VSLGTAAFPAMG